MSRDDEHPLIAFARATYGEHLCELLLAGYKELAPARSRSFVIRLEPAGERYLKVIADEQLGAEPALPYGDDPLVLLSLLKLLPEGGDPERPRVTFEYEDVLRLLGREASDESRALVDDAVARYFNLTYQPVKTLEELTGRAPVVFIHMIRMISRYDFVEAPGGNGSGPRRVENGVNFNKDFFENLRRRSLFGIGWDSVRSIELIT